MSFLISLLFGIAVGVAYALAGVKSPAPPVVALFGLLGIVVGEQGVAWLRERTAPRQAIERNEHRLRPAPPGLTQPRAGFPRLPTETRG